MVGRSGGGSGGAGFDYVQDPSPDAPEEGEEWYDTGSDRAFVFDGSNWIEQTIGDHSELSGIGSADHHPPIPTGVITMWSGSTADVPDGWTLCDGSDGTPDLRDRFIAGAGSQYGIGDTGGSDSVQLSKEEMPSHTHSLDLRIQGSYGSQGTYGDTDTAQNSYQTDSAGGDEPHENRPPFYALAFIMKT